MDSLQGLFNGLAGLAVVLGLVYCFAGYRIRRFIFAVPGYIAGAAIVGALAYLLAQEMWVAVLAGVFAGGPIGASIVLALYNVKVFSIGLLLGVVIDVALFLITDGQIEPAVLLIIPIVTGILALIYDKWIIVAGTAFGGAGLAVGGIAYFAFGGVGPAAIIGLLEGDPSLLAATIGGWLALGITGVVVQYQTRKPQDRADWWGGPADGPGTDASGSDRPSLSAAGRTLGRSTPVSQLRIRPQALTGHWWPVECLVWDPTGRWLATGGPDGRVRLWDSETGRPTLCLDGEYYAVHSLAVSPHGDWIAAVTGSNDLTKLMVWDTKTGEVLRTMAGFSARDFSKLAVGGSGDWLAVAEDFFVSIYDTRTWKPVVRSNKGYWTTSLAVSPDGNHFAWSFQEGGLHRWDATTRKKTSFTRYVSSVPGLAVCNLGSCVVIPRPVSHRHDSEEHGFLILSFDAGGLESRVRNNARKQQLFATAPNGAWLVGAFAETSPAEDNVMEYDTSHKRNLIMRWSMDFPPLRGDWKKGPVMQEIHLKHDWVRAFSVSPTGDAFATVLGNGKINIWSLTSSEPVQTLFAAECPSSEFIAFSPSGKHLAVAGSDRRLCILDLATGACQHRIEGHEYGLYDLVIAPDESWLASAGGDGCIRTWDVDTGIFQNAWQAHDWTSHWPNHGALRLALSASGDWLASAGKDGGSGQVKLWNARSHQQIWSAPSFVHYYREQTLFFLEQDRFLVINTRDADDSTIFSVKTGEPIGSRKNERIWKAMIGNRAAVRATTHTYENGRLDSCNFIAGIGLRWLRQKHDKRLSCDCTAPDKIWIASGDESGTIIVWDNRWGRFAHMLTGHFGPVESLVAAPSGRYLFSCGYDGIIRRWRVDQLPRKPHCDLAVQPLPEDNWVVWADPEGPKRRWLLDRSSPGAKRWLGWHAPIKGTDRWAHQPMDTYPHPP